ncbi:MAG: hypothetical protein GY866_09100 [Proteobacteria bacterium]|nr:hypothetical protein [Pseudomonadota bacterium]
MKKYLPYIGAFLLVLNVFVAYQLRDVVWEWIVVPFLEFLRTVDKIQGLAWIICVGIVTIALGRKVTNFGVELLLESDFFLRPKKRRIVRREPVWKIVEWIELARDGGYFQIRLAEYLGKLLLEIIAFRENLTPQLALNRLRSGSLEVPPSVEAYLRIGVLKEYQDQPRRSWIFFWRKAAPSIPKLDHEKILVFLEQQMNLGTNDENQRRF